MSFSEGSIFEHSPDALATAVDGKVMMMSIANGEYYHLDAVGSAIWDALASPAAVGKICEALQTRFDVSTDVCLSETIAFLTELQERGLVRRV